MSPNQINRINELAKKSKTPQGLTENEKAEQQILRDEYRKGVVANLKGQLGEIKKKNEDIPE
ncbi:MAG: DUF896 domain-containing protein [Oscillospiraceae bacterium]|nr:DUF896 domain-containing protein [Oscillospiraceae bacterium]